MFASYPFYVFKSYLGPKVQRKATFTSVLFGVAEVIFIFSLTLVWIKAAIDCCAFGPLLPCDNFRSKFVLVKKFVCICIFFPLCRESASWSTTMTSPPSWAAPEKYLTLEICGTSMIFVLNVFVFSFEFVSVFSFFMLCGYWSSYVVVYSASPEKYLTLHGCDTSTIFAQTWKYHMYRRDLSKIYFLWKISTKKVNRRRLNIYK